MDRKTFERLYRRYYRGMYRLARTLIYDADESHDVVDEVFARLLRGGLCPEASKTEGYLMTAVRRRCLDILRHRSLRERLGELSFAVPDDDAAYADTDDRAERLWCFVRHHLPPRTWRIFRLRFVEELTYEEIVQREGVSRVTVYHHLSDAVKLIRNHFKNDSDHE